MTGRVGSALAPGDVVAVLVTRPGIVVDSDDYGDVYGTAYGRAFVASWYAGENGTRGRVSYHVRPLGPVVPLRIGGDAVWFTRGQKSAIARAVHAYMRARSEEP